MNTTIQTPRFNETPRLLSVDEALEIVLREVRPLPVTRELAVNALGQTLAVDVISGSDSPPFDKALMDGFAIRSSDLANGLVSLRVIEEVTAGRIPTKPVNSGEATRIMTGAPLPDGADVVVRIEETRFDKAAGTVQIASAASPPGTNIMRRGAAMRAGDRILQAGRRLRPQEIGGLAELGYREIAVYSRPRVAVLATGDELVEVHETPGPGQIRNSNESMLMTQIQRAGVPYLPLGIARDDRQNLREKIRLGLSSADILVLSGGVSAGKLDLVPSELEAAGVQAFFHQISLKPGKPLWFGKLTRREQTGADPAQPATTYVFGLPGNPVSSLVCFELFVRTAIRQLLGAPNPRPRSVTARLSGEHLARSDRPTYHPARLQLDKSTLTVTPLRWQGSADLRAAIDANGMAIFPPGDRRYAAGEEIDVIPWDANDWGAENC